MITNRFTSRLVKRITGPFLNYTAESERVENWHGCERVFLRVGSCPEGSARDLEAPGGGPKATRASRSRAEAEGPLSNLKNPFTFMPVFTRKGPRVIWE